MLPQSDYTSASGFEDFSVVGRLEERTDTKALVLNAVQESQVERI